jgi:phosphoribosylformimino-5-aminoimidazole carboxamide ribotide isomerase
MALTSDFEMLPAIDLRGGQVVRLRQGDFARETAYGDDPAEVARRFAGEGAGWLHVVDLDGARTGEPAHVADIASIVAAVGPMTAIEAAGGLRTATSIADVLIAGATRVVLGTAALSEPAFAGRAVATHGADRIAVAIDVRDGFALGEGWGPGGPGVRAEDALRSLADQGVTTFEATAIDRDGLLGGPDLGLLARLVALDRGRVIASGGIASLEDLRAVDAIGCSGAIVGRALYEGRLDLGAALADVRRGGYSASR